jgi:hypothetical protein
MGNLKFGGTQGKQEKAIYEKNTTSKTFERILSGLFCGYGACFVCGSS